MCSIRKFWRLPLCVILALALVIGCFSISSAEEKKQYTIMFYVCGADLERDGGQFTAAFSSILSTRYNRDAVNAVSLLGGTPRWKGNAFDPAVLSVVNIAGRRPTVEDTFPLAAMSDGATLTHFLSYCKEHYPAEHYILVICDHGGGPLYGCCVDYLYSNSIMSVNSLKEALGNSPFADRGLDVIVFDCCLMGSAEIANSISAYAQYMVATEDSMYGIGFDWMKDVENDETVLETARRIAESTYQSNKEIIARQKASELNSVSVIDLQVMQDMNNAMTDYFASMPQLDESSFTRVSGSRRDAVDFGVMESGGNSQYDLVDIGSLVSTLEDGSHSGSALLDAIRTAVPYHYSDVDNCAGMTVYHPYLNKDAAKRYIETYASLGFSPSYVNYVINYAAIMTGSPLADWQKLMVEVPTAQKDNRTLFTLKLTEDQAANLGDSQMNVLQKEADGSYRFTFLTPDTSYENSMITGEFSGTALYAVDRDGNALTKPILYQISPKGYYLIPADLKKTDENGESVIQEALVYCSFDRNTKELAPGGIAVWDDAMERWNSNYLANYADYEEITIHQQTRNETRNADGILLPYNEWETASEDFWNVKIDDSWSFRFINDTIDTKDLYAAFEVQDSQGNQYLSELHAVRTGASTAEELRTAYDDLNLIRIDKLSVSMSNQLMLSAEVVNLTDTEAVIALKDLAINGEKNGITAEVYGTGPNWGLLQDEKQILSLTVPTDLLAGQDSVNTMTFTLLLTRADDSTEIGTVPVEVAMHLDLDK